jgi:hypothetical protein
MMSMNECVSECYDFKKIEFHGCTHERNVLRTLMASKAIGIHAFVCACVGNRCFVLVRIDRHGFN